ncbi:hypothetical protein ANCCAN_09784 [Ancylostoma caninum]|uniref:Uncharacterized protein n=1 Tax=Ancylostoma caninum TaxID=29170 RepID=A0A368GII7_ANCCA|nr:hypothetical protein ANCCAN_09784 [Ancylostoma caninum]
MTTQWDKVIFSDEDEFNLDDLDRYRHYWRDLWKEPFMFSRRNIDDGEWTPPNTKKCWEHICSLFEKSSAPFSRFSARQHCRPRVSFNENCLQEHRIYAVDRPACLSDCNQVENMWGIIARHVYLVRESWAKLWRLVETKNIGFMHYENAMEQVPFCGNQY